MTEENKEQEITELKKKETPEERLDRRDVKSGKIKSYGWLASLFGMGSK